MGTETGKTGNCGASARRRPEPARVRREPSAPGRAWARECVTTRTGTGTGRWTSHERRSDTAASWANSLLAQHIAPHGARRTVRRPRPHVSHGDRTAGAHGRRATRHATRDVTPRRVVRVHSSCARLMHADPHANRQLNFVFTHSRRFTSHSVTARVYLYHRWSVRTTQCGFTEYEDRSRIRREIFVRLRLRRASRRRSVMRVGC